MKKQFWIVFGIVVMFVTITLVIVIPKHSPSVSSEFSSSPPLMIDSDMGRVPKNPADNSPPPETNTGNQPEVKNANPLAVTGVEDIQKEPLTGERLQQYRLLQTSLHIQQEIYQMMLRNKDKETDPKMREQIQKDLQTIEKKIQEIQKELDKFH